jgi:hypothetical protein
LSKHYKTTTHFVAYLDLLGGTHLIQSQEDESLNKLHSLLQVAKESCIPNNKALFPKCKVKIFSDNIIIACKLTGNYEQDMLRINSAITLISAIQIIGLEMYRYLFRGGATIGNLFIDDVMVWGNALLRAYELESLLAVYPRIIIDEPLIEMMAMDKDIAEGDYSKYFITLDTDNIYYLDYLKAYFRLPHTTKNGTKFIEESYIYYKEELVSEADKVCQKLRWQVLYLDKYIENTTGENVLGTAKER